MQKIHCYIKIVFIDVVYQINLFSLILSHILVKSNPRHNTSYQSRKKTVNAEFGTLVFCFLLKCRKPSHSCDKQPQFHTSLISTIVPLPGNPSICLFLDFGSVDVLALLMRKSTLAFNPRHMAISRRSGTSCFLASFN